jgi:hypothetical protein
MPSSHICHIYMYQIQKLPAMLTKYIILRASSTRVTKRWANRIFGVIIWYLLTGCESCLIHFWVWSKEQISPICSSDLVSKRKYQIQLYNNAVQCSIARNQLSCCNNNKIFFLFCTQYSTGKCLFLYFKHPEFPASVLINGMDWCERAATSSAPNKW